VEYDTNVDFLTVTFRCPKEWAESVRQAKRITMMSCRKKPWFFYGYSGYVESIEEGHLATGKKAGGGIVQASGLVADLLCREWNCWLPDKVRFTRLDLALTFTVNKPIALVRHAADNLRDDWTVVLPSEAKGGGTLYIGDRKSNAFGRLYDKGAELNRRLSADQQIQSEYLWRAELEVKQARARSTFSEIVKAQASGDLRGFIADTVLTWFRNRCMYLPVLPKAASIVSVAHRAADDVRTIKWLHEQVRPAVWRLAEKGMDIELAKALNIVPGNFALDAPRYLEENYGQFSFFDQLS
jgi:DNA relaxase NicK